MGIAAMDKRFFFIDAAYLGYPIIILQGLQHVPKDEAVIIASKHQSLLETFIFFHHIPKFFSHLKARIIMDTNMGLVAWAFRAHNSD